VFLNPDYRVLVYKTLPASGSGFGVGDLLVEYDKVMNIGYARYLSDPGEAFWTVIQDDPKIGPSLRGYTGTAHVKILRNGEVVWRGILSEFEANRDDVVFYAYGYESLLYRLLSQWNMTWKEEQIDTIVTDLWTRAKTTLTYSKVGFVTTGTIEAPVTTSGGATAIELPSYKLYYKRILFSFQELVALGTSDTTNIVYFEIDYPQSATNNAATFNFWKNRSDLTTTVHEYGYNADGFFDRYVPILGRNDILGVGSGAQSQLYRYRQQTAATSAGYELFGREQEPIYLSWVRDQADLQRVTKLRAKRALRADVDLILRMRANEIIPFGATGASYRLGDRVRVRAELGITSIDKDMLVVGQQVWALRGHERVYPMYQERNPA